MASYHVYGWMVGKTRRKEELVQYVAADMEKMPSAEGMSEG